MIRLSDRNYNVFYFSREHIAAIQTVESDNVVVVSLTGGQSIRVEFNTPNALSGAVEKLVGQPRARGSF